MTVLTRLNYYVSCFKVLGKLHLAVPETLPYLALEALTRSVPQIPVKKVKS